MLNVFSAEETIEIIYRNFSPVKVDAERVPLCHAIGRVLSEDIDAREDNPWFSRSTVDGYAVLASDTAGASDTLGVLLEKTDEVKMGVRSQQSVKSGTAIYVPTGGAVPTGANAVVMIEYCEECGDDIYIKRNAAIGENLIFIGDDAKCGETVLAKGTKITEKTIGALAALGYEQVPVQKRLTCGILSTGDELISVEQAPDFEKAQVRDVNSYFSGALAEKWGMAVRNYGICPDQLSALTELIKKASEECELVLLSGGSSAGVMDNSAAAIAQAGGTVLVHGIAVKPGKPTIIGILNQKAVVALPGHPVSAYFVAREMVRHIYLALSGEKPVMETYILAEAGSNIPSNHGRSDFVPVCLEQEGEKVFAQPLGYKSGLIMLMARADGYIKIPRESEGIKKGEWVKVYLF